MAERGVQLRHFHAISPRRAGRARRRRHRQQVPRAQRPRIHLVREPADPGRPLAQLPRPRRGRDDHGRGPVADRGAVVRPQRFRHVRPRQQLRGRDRTRHLRTRVGQGRGPAARGHLRHVLLGPPPGLQAEPRLQRRDRHRVRPQRGEQVRVELQRQHAPQFRARGLAEPVGQRDLRLAGEDLRPRLVQGPRGVHLHVRFHRRRHRADGVHRRHERERPPGQVVRGSRAPEPDVGSGQPGGAEHLREDRHQHLHPAGGGVLAHPARRLREPDDSNV